MKPEIVLGVITLVVTVVAVMAAPIIALWVQRRADEKKEARGRRLATFKTLMAYRSTRINPLFVQALNSIDIEFTDPSERNVRNAWKELADHYDEWGKRSRQQVNYDNRDDLTKANELLAELLVTMGGSLGYEFDRVYIKKASYYPEGLGNIEQEQHALRGALLNLLAGRGAKLPVAVFTQDFEQLAVQPLQVPAPQRAPVIAQPQPQQLQPGTSADGGHDQN
ncbi:MAG TPA: DUF6680 family protein [Candidatus Angelobacter sp.]|jgi:hypothetical protein